MGLNCNIVRLGWEALCCCGLGMWLFEAVAGDL